MSIIPQWARPVAAALCAGTALVALAGCSRGPNLKLVPVSGKVLYNGSPLSTGSLSFRPNTNRGNTNTAEPAGEIDDQGNYKLFTAGKEGAPPGWYRVGVVSTGEPDPNNISAPPKSFIPRKYGEATNSGLEIEVVDQPAAGAYDLKLPR